MRLRLCCGWMILGAGLVLLAPWSARGEETAPAEPVSIMDQLLSNRNADVQKVADGLVITSKTKAEAKVAGTTKFKVPCVVTASVMTQSKSIRLFYGLRGLVIFDLDIKPDSLRYRVLRTGAMMIGPGQGAIPPNTWATVRLVFEEKRTVIQVDGVDRATYPGDNTGQDGVVGVGTFGEGAVVSVRSLDVTQLAPGTTTPAGKPATPQPPAAVPGAVGAGTVMSGSLAPSGARPLGTPGAMAGTAGSGVAGSVAMSATPSAIVGSTGAGGGSGAAGSGVSAVPVGPVGPVNPNAIERAEFRNKSKPIVKSLTSVTAMMVHQSVDGGEVGIVGDIIATVQAESRNSGTPGSAVLTDREADKVMMTTFDEAGRAVKLRYPFWEPGRIDISFGEKFEGHGGPSAGTAFALLMLSTLEGFDLDPKCAVTGDITVDWKVRAVGGITAKLRGAAVEKCTLAAIPASNEMAFQDMAFLYGHPSMWSVQVFSIATLQQAQALARVDRSASLTEAMKAFAGLQTELTGAEWPTLHDPNTQTTLKHILELAPNHLSAKFLLALSNGTAPKALSSTGTLFLVSSVFHPFRVILEAKQPLNRTTLPAGVVVDARKRLDALRPMANKDVLPVLIETAALIENMDEFAAKNSRAVASSLAERAEAVQTRLTALDTDPALSEKMVREGY